MIVPETAPRPTAWCLFQSCSRHWAVPLENVAEIIAVDRLVRMPLCPPELLGLCTLRREVIPVLLPVPYPSTTELVPTTHVILILRVSRGLWGLPILREGTIVTDDELADQSATSITTSDLNERTKSARSATSQDPIVRGNVRYDLLNPEAAWAEARTSVERWYGRGVSKPTTATLTEPEAIEALR